MYNVICFILSVILVTCAQSWGACTWFTSVNYSVNNIRCTDCPTQCSTAGYVKPKDPTGTGSYYVNPKITDSCTACEQGSSTGSCAWRYQQRCSTEREADSLACELKGDLWNTETGQCSKCTLADSTWRESTCGYSVRKSMYLNVVTTCQRTNCHVECISREYYAQTCDTTGADSSITCMGSIDGVNVYLRGASGRVTSCNADGSCSFALQKVALGQCPNPNDPPTQRSSSSGQGEQSSSSSGDGEQSSSSGGGVSSSEQGTSQIQEDWEWLKDSLGAIHRTEENIEEWTPFISGTYDGVINLNGVAHDVNSNLRVQLDLQAETRDKAAQTATNTANIDNKLNTTNNLLNDIKNKNWSPNINVAGDTIINNVTVEGDTSRAPSEILALLKGLVGGDTTGNYDSTGWGATSDTAMHATDSAIAQGTWTSALSCDTTGGRKCDGSIIGAHGLDSARSGIKGTFGAMADTVRNGAFGDSLADWGSKFTGGTITGSGSDACPAVLARQYHIELLQGAGFDLTLGRYLCSPLVGQTTAWSLCRLLLRASVALACMWFLFHSATGFGGKDED